MTIEIILVVLIIAILATIALPNMARMVDVARLDYEVKKFCSDFDFAHSLGKQAEFDGEIFSNALDKNDVSRKVVIQINERAGTYQISRNTTLSNVPIRDAHILSDGISINAKNNSTICFLPDGTVADANYAAISDSFVFTSRYNSFSVSVDSVGRWRGKR